MTDRLPFGTWPSPVSPEMLTEGTVGLVDVWVDGATTVWLESRAAEAGRLQIVVLDTDGSRRDLLPEGFSARSMVHEYGGGAAHVANGDAWFVNFADQRVYRLPVDGSAPPLPVTPAPPSPRSVRFADLRPSADGRWLLCVRETHRGTAAADVDNELVAVPLDGGEPVVLYAAADFVMSPAFLDASTVRCVAWDHPNMPWDTTRLVEIDFVDGDVRGTEVVAGGCSLMQPDGQWCISDRHGWWNLATVADGAETPVEAAEHEVGGPAWVFGLRSYARVGDGSPVYSVGGSLFVRGVRHDTDAAGFEQFAVSGDEVTAIASYRDRQPAIVRFHADDPLGSMRTVVASRSLAMGPGDVSEPREIIFPTPDGRHAYAWFYEPENSAFRGPDGDLPPLVVMIHGGPTSCAKPFFALSRQFWTSRGFAVVDVNHRGSTGFGTAFRRLLDGAWGVVDVEDCAAAAAWLTAEGLVDGSRVVIRGGSAGGFTVLASLATTGVYAAGADLFGIADLTALAADTHKFECRYLDNMIGPWPEAEAVWVERSPINHLEGFANPLVVFQGADDMVVLPNQSEMIADALGAKGVECEYHLYTGEGHGFRRAETIVHQLTHELAFYRRVLGLDC